MERRFTPALGREVFLREGNSDQEVWDATFVHQYHVPPVDISPKTVLDLGANIGLTAAHYKALWPEAHVVAVEMDEECADLILLNAPECEVHICAVSGEGDTGFYDSSLWSSNFAFGETGDKQVGSLTLTEILDGQPVDFVKMDVEGAEWDVLEHGDWARHVKTLLVELHGERSDTVLRSLALFALERLGFTATHHKIHPRSVWATRWS